VRFQAKKASLSELRMAHALVIGEPFNLKVFAFQSWLGLRLLTGDIYKTTEASAAPSEWHIGR
jgi:hypothetical protein